MCFSAKAVRLNALKCPYCKYKDTQVLDSREAEDSTRRRRQCPKCNKRFTTYEKMESLSLTVIKKNGDRVRFDRDKILNGILKACEKRSITREKIEAAVEDLEQELRTLATTEIPTKKIGELVMNKLKKLDKVAYIRFASVYREFADLETFEKELKKLIRR